MEAMEKSSKKRKTQDTEAKGLESVEGREDEVEEPPKKKRKRRAATSYDTVAFSVNDDLSFGETPGSAG